MNVFSSVILAVQMLAEVVSGGLARADQEHRLSELAGLGPEAAAAWAVLQGRYGFGKSPRIAGMILTW